MRDIKARRDINVKGDMIVNDHSQQYKLLIHCSNEELTAEEKHRMTNLSEERARKLNKVLSFVALAAVLIFIAGGWYWLRGNIDMFSLLVGGAGLMVSVASLKIYERPTLFEQRQLAALQEIHLLLRERGVRK